MIALATVQTDVDSYIDRVLSGEQVACATVVGACRRHRADLGRMTDPDFPYVFNPRLAWRSCQFFPMVLRHSTGEWAGLPFEIADWQRFIVWCLFGWRQKSDDMRRFRRAYISVGRKNGKSTVVSGIGLLCLHLDGEPGAQVFVAATKKEQAAIIYGEAERMTRSSEWLAKRTSISKYNLAVLETYSFMRPTSSDKPYDGLSPHAVLMDELHAWTDTHRRFYDTITSGSGSRRQPLFVVATTAGDDKSHIWREEDDHARRVANGEIQDERLFSFVASLDDEDDPFDETVWEKANPNLGISLKLDYLRQQAAEARSKPTYRNAFVRYHCNRRVSNVEHVFSAEKWNSLRGDLSDWGKADSIGIGVDLGGRDDMAAWAACAKFKIGETDDGKAIFRYELLARSYIVKNTKRDLDKAPWNVWLWDGKVTQGEHVIAMIKDDVVAFSLEHGCEAVAFDPHNARQLGDEIEASGVPCYSMSQTHGQYNEPLKAFIDAAVSGQLRHNGDEVLAWCAANMAIGKNSRDEWMPDKKDSKEKIDTIVAAVMAFRVAYFSTRETWFYDRSPLEIA